MTVTLDMTCETNGCRRGGCHIVETYSGIKLRLCPGCYDRWFEMFGRLDEWGESG